MEAPAPMRRRRRKICGERQSLGLREQRRHIASVRSLQRYRPEDTQLNHAIAVVQFVFPEERSGWPPFVG
jgi:hypothetical protein